MKNCGIYRILNTKNNKCYIGSSKNIKNRWARHLTNLNTNQHHSPSLQRAWNKYGKDLFIFELLMEAEESMLLDIEMAYFMAYRPEYNIAKHPSSPMLGRTASDETKAKMSAALKGRKHSDETKAKIATAHIGMKHTEESKLKMSAVQKGKKHSDEARERMSAAKKGKVFSDEHKENLSKALKGNNCGVKANAKRARAIIAIKNGEVFKSYNSIAEAFRDGCCRASIRTAIKDKKIYKECEWQELSQQGKYVAIIKQ